MTIPVRALALAAALIAPALLAGCGKLGDLERPGALAPQAANGEAQPARPQDPTRPVKTVDPRDQATLPTPR